MPLPLSPKDRLGHERDGLAVLVGHVLDDVLVEQHVVGGAAPASRTQIDFRLAAGCDFVMMALDLQAAALHGHDHFAAQVLVVIGRRHREIAFLVARTVAQIVLFAAGVPAAFFRVDEVEAVLLALIEADVVEDEKLGFGAEVGGVGHAGGGQIHLRLFRDVARIAVVALLGDGIDDVADHDQRWNFGERIHHVACRDRESAACRFR